MTHNLAFLMRYSGWHPNPAPSG